MKRMAVGLLAIVLWAPLAPAQSNSPISDRDRSSFDTLFGEKLTSVARTRSTTDDKVLANDMLNFAGGLPDTDAGAKCLVYAEIITLASNTADLGLIREAFGLLETIWPEQDLVSPELLMQRASRAYQGVERRDRDEQGGHYIELLMGIARHYENENDPEQAIGVCRLASTIARTIDSDQFDLIQDKLERLSAASDMAKRIKMLELSVQKNPQNSPAARELVKLLITEHNDIEAAARYVESTRDEELTDLVQRCLLGIDQANAATAMRVGDWYIALAEDVQDEKALKLLQKSRDWYEQFFALYRREDALAKRAAEMDNLALLKIEHLVADNPELVEMPRDGWLPLIAPPFDPDKHKLGQLDVFEVERNEITIDNGALMIPFDKARAYEVRLTLTIHVNAGEEAEAWLYLPVSNNRFILTRYHAAGDTLARVDKVSEDRLLKNLPDRTGQKIQLTYQVAELNGQVAFALLYQGKAALKWQGGLEELEELDEEQRARLPADVGNVMLLRCFKKLTIHAVDYKPRG